MRVEKLIQLWRRLRREAEEKVKGRLTEVWLNKWWVNTSDLIKTYPVLGTLCNRKRQQCNDTHMACRC